MLEFVIGYSMGSKSQSRMYSLARTMEAAQGGMQSERIEQVNVKLENLGLIVRALWSLLEDQGMTADQLMDRIESIQAQVKAEKEDDIPDAMRCRTCDSMVGRGLLNCQICGAKMEGNELHPLDI